MPHSVPLIRDRPARATNDANGVDGLRNALSSAQAGTDRDDPRALLRTLGARGLLKAFVEPRTNGGFRYTDRWRAVFDVLVLLGSVDLSLARLFEGHVNALQLVALYGSRAQQDRVVAIVNRGGLLGVWGADGPEPVRRTPAGSGTAILSGAKRYASGAGVLHTALVPINETDGTMTLLLLDVRDEARIDLSSWDLRGMRGSLSGTYDFSGVEIGSEDVVGARDDYRREPFFVGGIWRCAAAQLGAIEAIVKDIASDLSASGRDGHPLQMARIGEAIIAARSARLWILDAAARVEDEAGTDDAAIARTVALSAYGRLVTERAAMAVIDLAERAIGLQSFVRSHPIEAMTRDLAVYIRQANPDAVLLQHGRTLAAGLPL